MTSTSPQIIKQLEKEMTKESKTEEQRLKQAMKDLTVTEKQQAKAHKAVLKAESKLAKVHKKESTANEALVKATQKHDLTASSVQNAEKTLQDRKDADMKLQQEIDAKKAQVQTAIQGQKNNELNRRSKLKHMKESPGIVGGESAPVPGHSTGFATIPGGQAETSDNLPSNTMGQPRNLAVEQPMSNPTQAMNPNLQPTSGAQDTATAPMNSVSQPTSTAPMAATGAMQQPASPNANLSPPQEASRLQTPPMQGQSVPMGQNMAARDPNLASPQDPSRLQSSPMQAQSIPPGQNLAARDPNQTAPQFQNLPDQTQASRGQNIAAPQAVSPNIDQGPGASGLRDPSNRMQPSPLATNEPITNPQAGGNPSAHGAGLGQSQLADPRAGGNPSAYGNGPGQSQLADPQAGRNPSSYGNGLGQSQLADPQAGGNPSAYGTGLNQSQPTNPASGMAADSSNDPMRQMEGSRSAGGQGFTGSDYGTPPEQFGGLQSGMQGTRDANLAGIGAGGMGPTSSNVPAGGVTHPVTGDTFGIPQGNVGIGNDTMKTGGQGMAGNMGNDSNIQDSSGRRLDVPGVGKNFVASDVVDSALAGDTRMGYGGL